MFVQTHRNKTALVLPQIAMALLCLWMSGIAQLNHTDDLSAFQSYTRQHTQTLSSAQSGFVTDMCAACDYDQLQNQSQTPAVVLAYQSFTRLQYRADLPVSVGSRCFDHYAYRGPPTTNS